MPGLIDKNITPQNRYKMITPMKPYPPTLTASISSWREAPSLGRTAATGGKDQSKISEFAATGDLNAVYTRKQQSAIKDYQPPSTFRFNRKSMINDMLVQLPLNINKWEDNHYSSLIKLPKINNEEKNDNLQASWSHQQIY